MASSPREPTPSAANPTTPALLVAFLLGTIGLVASIASLFLTLPAWAGLLAVTSLAIGMVLAAYLSFTFARRSGRSWLRVFFRTLWAPIKFLFDFTV